MDYLLKALALKDQVRVYIASTTSSVNEVIKRGDLWPSAASILGKVMTTTAMMGSMLKGEEALTVKVNGGGQIGNVICDGNSKGEIRGYVDRPHVNFVNTNGGLNESLTLGNNGFIDVIKDLKLKDLFTSSIPLETGNLAYDFTYYFTVSEQTPSMVSLGSKIDTNNQALVMGGIIVQVLPNTSEGAISYLEQKANLLNNFSNLLEQYTLEEILHLIFIDDFRILEKIPVSFKCNCSKEKFMGGIASLGSEEIKDMINEDHQAEIICQYCKEKYIFTEDELKKILERVKNNDKQKLYS